MTKHVTQEEDVAQGVVDVERSASHLSKSHLHIAVYKLYEIRERVEKHPSILLLFMFEPHVTPS